jgi:hypothetical protein
MGVYVLMEKIKRGKERVNIAKLNPEDSDKSKISGGYIVKRDHSEGGGSHFRTERGGPFFYVYPKPREITPAQRAWIKRYFGAFEDALYGEDFADPENQVRGLPGCGWISRFTLADRAEQERGWLSVQRLHDEGSRQKAQTGASLGLEPGVGERELLRGRVNERLVLDGLATE